MQDVIFTLTFESFVIFALLVWILGLMMGLFIASSLFARTNSRIL